MIQRRSIFLTCHKHSLKKYLEQHFREKIITIIYINYYISKIICISNEIHPWHVNITPYARIINHYQWTKKLDISYTKKAIKHLSQLSVLWRHKGMHLRSSSVASSLLHFTRLVTDILAFYPENSLVTPIRAVSSSLLQLFPAQTGWNWL